MIGHALMQLRTDRARISGTETMPDENGIERKKEVVFYEDLPCRISFSSFPAAEGEGVSKAVQEIRLFLPPGTDIPPGSRIEVSRDGKPERYRKSGAAAVYPTHVEINLTREERWT